jgi:hypothetical protein
LTAAPVTPVAFLALRSTDATQLAQVIPITGSVICFSELIFPLPKAPALYQSTQSSLITRKVPGACMVRTLA